MLTASDGKILLKNARLAIEAFVNRKRFTPTKELSKFTEPSGVFVSMHKKGELCGCVGLPWPTKPLSEALPEAAVQACQDHRFSPLIPDEVSDIEIEVSVLTQPEELKISNPNDLISKLKPGKDGLIIRKGELGALFLPQVWDEIPDPNDFLAHLCVKAGLPPDAWTQKGCKFLVFQVQIFKEDRFSSHVNNP